ncbi:nuclear transport factor 2 family protein [Bradyrhizobium sp. SYSU BS000235]|uniref:nuclear transport factor 2 family protein n=1 Tax=Bradyrhizobium sp. SYSU BS000235 TaxID=3411332 RepID=UPI003C722EF6
MPEQQTKRQQLLVTLFEAFNRHDANGVMACMTDGIIFDAAGGPEMFGRRIVGTAEVKAAFEKVWTDMPDVSWTCTAHHVFGDRGLSEWIFRGTTASGTRIEAEGCDLFTFSGDKLSRKSAFRKDRPPLPASAARAAS